MTMTKQFQLIKILLNLGWVIHFCFYYKRTITKFEMSYMFC